MEQNSDRMGFALVALVVVALVLFVMNTVFKDTVEGFFGSFKTWMTNTFTTITDSNEGAGTIPSTIINIVRSLPPLF